MDYQFSQRLRTWLFISTFAVFILISLGCSRPNPNPELTDPIYADLGSRASVAKAAAETAKEDIKRMRAELAALPARDTTRKKLKDDITKKELHLVVADQESLYYEIRAEQRKKYAQTEYLKAFEAGKEWPDPNDFETYKIQRKLREAPREWSNKLPKTGRYNKKTGDELRQELEEKLKSAPGGGSAH